MTTDIALFKTTEISATSRASVKIGESYFTFEASETRQVVTEKLPKESSAIEETLKNEWVALFDIVNQKVDEQIADIKACVTKK
mgnify:CR=1 FL=1